MDGERSNQANISEVVPLSFSNIVSNREVSRSEAETDRRESFRITQSIPEGVLDLEGFLKLRRGVASEIRVGFRVPEGVGGHF